MIKQLKEIKKLLQAVLAYLEEDEAALKDNCGDDDDLLLPPCQKAIENVQRILSLI